MTAETSGTVKKALSLLDEFLDGSNEISLSQFALRTGLNKTTIIRLCASLEEAGFLQRAPGKPYRIGPKIWQLSRIYQRQAQLEDIVRPYLQRVRDATGESVSFYVIDKDERVCLFRENSHSVIRHHADEGSRLPLNADGVVGRVLLAFLGTPGKEFDDIRRRGYLFAQGREPHTTSVAVPVLDNHGNVRGGIVISGPSIRFKSCQHALPLIQEAAEDIRLRFPFEDLK